MKKPLAWTFATESVPYGKILWCTDEASEYTEIVMVLTCAVTVWYGANKVIGSNMEGWLSPCKNFYMVCYPFQIHQVENFRKHSTWILSEGKFPKCYCFKLYSILKNVCTQFRLGCIRWLFFASPYRHWVTVALLYFDFSLGVQHGELPTVTDSFVGSGHVYCSEKDDQYDRDMLLFHYMFICGLQNPFHSIAVYISRFCDYVCLQGSALHVLM